MGIHAFLTLPSTTASRQVAWRGDICVSLHSPHCAHSKLAVPVVSASCERIHWGFYSDADLQQLPPSCSHRTSRCTGYKQASGATWAAPPGSDDPRLVRAVELVLTCTEQPEGRINYITSFSPSHKENQAVRANNSLGTNGLAFKQRKIKRCTPHFFYSDDSKQGIGWNLLHACYIIYYILYTEARNSTAFQVKASDSSYWKLPHVRLTGKGISHMAVEYSEGLNINNLVLFVNNQMKTNKNNAPPNDSIFYVPVSLIMHTDEKIYPRQCT